jgi:yersiniabactin nonribosomal peptide synthetase
MSISDSTLSTVSGTVYKVVGEVLKQSVEPTDNMLQLGVDSLVGTRIVVSLRSELGVEVPLLLIFENPVLGDFAAGVAELVQDHSG